MALLLASVLAPVVLYSGAPISPFSSGPILAMSAFGRDPSNLIARTDVGKRLNALPQDTFDAVKEPAQTAASDADALKERMIIVGNHGTQLGQDSVIQQVDGGSSINRSGGSRGNKDDGVRNVEEMKGSHDPSKRERVDDMVITLKEGAQLGKQNGLSNDGEAGENNVRAMHNTGYLNVPLNKFSRKILLIDLLGILQTLPQKSLMQGQLAVILVIPQLLQIVQYVLSRTS